MYTRLSLPGVPRCPCPSLLPRLAEVRGHYVRMLDMNSLKRFEYCSGFTVEISAPACKRRRRRVSSCPHLWEAGQGEA